MRFYLLSTFAALAAGEEELALESVYGPVNKVDYLVPFFNRTLPDGVAPNSRLGSRTSEFFELRRKDYCHFPLEVLLIQDATSSFDDDIDNMRDTQLELMVKALEKSHPGSYYSVISFRDKPVDPLGVPETDFCYKFLSPMSSDVQVLVDVYAGIHANGGGDPPENQFGAILAGAASQTPGWSNPLASRLIVLSTDAPPHFADDGKNVPNLPPFSGTYEENSEDQCLKEYYPAPEVIKNALLQREAYATFLVYDPDWWNSLPVRSWKWFNSFIEQPDEFVNPLANDASNFWEVLSKVISEIEEAECRHETTTEAPLATTVDPTSATTTEQATTTATTTEQVTTTATTTEQTTTEQTTTEQTTTTATTTEHKTTTKTTTTESPPQPECPCAGCCPEVVVKLAKRPKTLHLDVSN